MHQLTFRSFSLINRQRCEESFHDIYAWSLTDWATALAGETGELCNLLKKVRRRDFRLDDCRQEIARELGDIIAYADLLAQRAGIDLETAVAAKFNEVSERVGSPHRIGPLYALPGISTRLVATFYEQEQIPPLNEDGAKPPAAGPQGDGVDMGQQRMG